LGTAKPDDKITTIISIIETDCIVVGVLNNDANVNPVPILNMMQIIVQYE
jgi:hypothetical protein